MKRSNKAKDYIIDSDSDDEESIQSIQSNGGGGEHSIIKDSSGGGGIKSSKKKAGGKPTTNNPLSPYITITYTLIFCILRNSRKISNSTGTEDRAAKENQRPSSQRCKFFRRRKSDFTKKENFFGAWRAAENGRN